MDAGEKIRKLREERHMTLEEFGDKVGVGKSTVRKWEKGFIKDIGSNRLQLIADAFHVSPEYFFDLPDKQKQMQRRMLMTYFERLNEDGRKMLYDRAIELIKLGYAEEEDSDISRDSLSSSNEGNIAQ